MKRREKIEYSILLDNNYSEEIKHKLLKMEMISYQNYVVN